MDPSLFERLGLQPSASLADVKQAYGALAKKYHPDKNTNGDAKTLFQELNKAYHVLTSDLEQRMHDASENDTEPNVEILPNITLTTKEITQSVAIDITDLMFLAFLEECQNYHGVVPIDRGHHGLQLRFDYTSPDDDELYGTLSLTFYPTTSRLLVQGSSYLLWIEEHLPIIYNETEHRYMQNASLWSASTRRRGIGIRRDRPSTRGGRNPTQGRLRSSRVTQRALDEKNPSSPTGEELPLPSPMPKQNAIISTLVTEDCLEPSSRPADEGPDTVMSGSDLSLSTHEVCARPPLGPEDVAGISTPVTSPSKHPHSAPPTEDSPSHHSPSTPAHKRPSRSRHKIHADAEQTSTETKSACEKRGKNKKAKKLNKDTNDNTKYCGPNCNRENRGNKNMIRCSLCMTWFHIQFSKRDYVGVWVCEACRKLPSIVHNLHDQLSDLLKVTKTNDALSQDEISKLKT